jgi:hypothetical protein
VQQRRVFRSAAASVIRHHVVGRVNMETMVSSYATRDC